MRRSLGPAYQMGGRIALGGASVAMAGSVLSSSSSDPSPRRRDAKTPYDFGHPARRLTDVILGLNALVFAADSLLRLAHEPLGPLTLAGAKINEAISGGQVRDISGSNHEYDIY